MKYFLKTFGCQMNFADSDELGGHLKARGFTLTEDIEEADAILINTCTVRAMAEHKASSYIGKLKDWKQARPPRLLLVTGCAAEHAGKAWQKRFPHVDLIVGAKGIAEFPARLDAYLKSRFQDFDDPIPTHQLIPITSNAVIQYVTVMRGCNYNCTYCIVPSVRGREIYRSPEEIIAETATRVSNGAREIWLLGQTVNSYTSYNKEGREVDFADLLRLVDGVNGMWRLRFMSPHPYYMTEKLARAMAESTKVCEYIHLPVQSGSNAVLSRMKRNYTRESYLKSLKILRAAIPSIVISTDFIVGFPGETDADFQQTLSLVKEAGFDSAYCFKYSPRPGTPAFDMKDDVPQAIKEKRVNDLLALTDEQGRSSVEKLLKTEQEILIEDDKGNGLFRGKTRGAWRARLKCKDIRLGQFVKARVTDTHSRELHAEII